MAGVDVFAVVEISFLVFVPVVREGRSFTWASSYLVNSLHAICVRSWLLLGISEHCFGYWSPTAFSECGCFIASRGFDFWLKNIKRVWHDSPKTLIFGERMLPTGMTPCRCRLIPLWNLFLIRLARIDKVCSFWSDFTIKTCCPG